MLLKRLDHIESELGVPLSIEGIDTVGGFVFTLLGHLPKPGERLRVDGVADLKVRRVSRTRVQQVELRPARIHPAEEEP